MMKRLWLIWLLLVISQELLHQSKLFLVDGESSVFFPHRQLQHISISSSQCASKQADIITHRPLMQTLARIAFNNTNQGISMLQDDIYSSSMQFYYAKINLHGICTVYSVEGETIRIQYEFDFGEQFTNVIILDEFHTFLWNCKSFAVMQYSPFIRSVMVLRKQFQVESGRNCNKYSSTGIICWGQDDIVDIIMQKMDFSVYLYQWNQETIKIILYLDKQLKVTFVCSFTVCIIAKLADNHTIEVINTFPFVQPILGADFNPITKQIVIIHSFTAIVLAYNPFVFELNLIQSIDFYEEFSCIFIENVRLLSEQILVNCNNFMGEAKHLVIMKDDEVNRYFAYQPIRNVDQDNPCLFDGNDKYIFAVCKTEILTKFNNFEYFSISHQAKGNIIIIQCIDINQDAIKIPQSFLLTIQTAQYGHAYVNQQIALPNKINYDDSISLKLRKSFTANAIQSYSIFSPQCPFFEQILYSTIRNLNFFSIFIQQNCVQIVSSDSQSFLRVLEINSTLYYIQQCQKIKMDLYGCQLQEIIEGFQQLRVIIYQIRIYKLYLYQGNLVIESQITTLILFNSVTSYQIRNSVLRVLSNKKYYSKPILNAIFGSGGWIQQISNSVYRFSQGSIFQLRQNGNIFHYNNKRAIQISVSPMYLGNYLKQSIFPFIIVKGFFTFIINQTHISKIYIRQTTEVIYQMHYNIQKYEVSEIKSVDNYITIQYVLGFFQVYDIERSAVEALIAVEQQEVLCDIMLVDKGVILVPVKSQPYIISIDTDPTVSFRISDDAIYSKFREQCSIIINPHMSNGSCPNEEESKVNQTIHTVVSFDIQKITLENHIIIHQQPFKCNDCLFYLDQMNFNGPIFAYELNDDYYNAFELTSHLNIKDCSSQNVQHLSHMQELHMAQENMRSQALLINKTDLVVVDQKFKELYRLQFSNQNICVSYTVIEQYYLVLCNKIFVLFNKDNTTIYIDHDITIGDSSSTLDDYYIHSQLIINSKYHIYILSSKTMLKYTLDISTKTLIFLSSQQYASKVFDFTIAGNRLITLQNKQLCISASGKGENSCYNLETIIPFSYARDYSYHDLAAYHSTDTTLKALLISKTNDNLHIDLQINFQNFPAQFQVLNAYVGYTGFIAKSIVMINSSTQGKYSSFVLYYESQGGDPQESSFIAYYPFNKHFKNEGILGQIRSALFLSTELQDSYSFTFFSFTQRFYIASLPPLRSLKRKKCIEVEVQEKLKIKSSYEQPPLMKFLIVKIKNINDLQPLYIKILYLPEQIMLVDGLIGLGVIIVLFTALVVATNRCKEEGSDLMIHFMSEDIEKEFSESEDNSSSDLLHSKTSPSSPRSIQPSNEDYQQ